jgi:ribosomal-protein-alanine N-acetyltransferase
MIEADLPSVLNLQNTLGFQKWNEKQFLSELRASYALCLVDKEAGTFAGYAIFHLMGSDSELLTIAVDPKFQRKGIASALLHEGLDKLNRENGDHCFLEVRQGNDRARSLYEKHGFQAYSQRERYYDDGETAILYKW